MTQTLEDIKKEFRSMSEAELLEFVAHNRHERATVTTDKIKAVRKKAGEKNVAAAVDALTTEQILEIARRRGVVATHGDGDK